MIHHIIIKGKYPAKKNTYQIVGRRIISLKYKSWARDNFYQVHGYDHLNIQQCDSVQLDFWCPDNRGRDLANFAETIMDFLEDAGVISNDKWQVTGPLILTPKGIDRNNPRCEIWLKVKH